MPVLVFGSNSFDASTTFTAVGLDASGAVVFGGFGPPPRTPLVWVEFRQGTPYLNADISDADGEAVARLRDSVLTYDSKNIYSVETTPRDTIPPERIVIVNRYGETALDLSKHGDAWELNADLYCARVHIVATPKGTFINPPSPMV